MLPYGPVLSFPDYLTVFLPPPQSRIPLPLRRNGQVLSPPPPPGSPRGGPRYPAPPAFAERQAGIAPASISPAVADSGCQTPPRRLHEPPFGLSLCVHFRNGHMPCTRAARSPPLAKQQAHHSRCCAGRPGTMDLRTELPALCRRPLFRSRAHCARSRGGR